MVKCGNCRHYKDRYTLFMHGDFPTLKRLLELNLIDERDFICEGWGCVFHPTQDFAHDEHGLPILEEDFPYEECEFYEPKNNRKELAKRIVSMVAWKERGGEHMDISHIEVTEDDVRKVRLKS